MRKTLPPIGITTNNVAIGPKGNEGGQCCGKCACTKKAVESSENHALRKKLKAWLQNSRK